MTQLDEGPGRRATRTTITGRWIILLVGWLALALAIGLAGLEIGGIYHVTAVNPTFGVAYKLNRFTGTLWICTVTSGCAKLPEPAR